MKRVMMAASILSVVALTMGGLLAQPPKKDEGAGRKRSGNRARGGQPGGERSGRGGPGRRGPGGPGFGARPKPGEILPGFIQEQLKLTAEQKTKLEALQKEVSAKLDTILTKDQKKQLTEMGERRGGGRFRGRPGGEGGPGGRFGRRPGGEGGPGGRPGGEAGNGASSVAERLMKFDKNKDKKLSKDELPAIFQRVFDRADTNKDNFLDESELKKLAGSGSRGIGGRGGRGRFGGGRPGRRPGGDGERPGGRPKME